MKFLKWFRDWEDTEEYAVKSVIFSPGDAADGLYVILSGEIELTLHGKLLGTEGVGGIIGEMAIIQAATLSAKATALTDVKLARLNREQFIHFTRESTEFSLHVMAVLANRLRAVDQYITAQIEKAG